MSSYITAILILEGLTSRREVIRDGALFLHIDGQVLHLLSACLYNLNYLKAKVLYAFLPIGNFKM